MTKLEIIEETVAFYGEDTTRRAADKSGRCFYKINENSCAVGRCFDKNYYQYDELSRQLGVIDDVVETLKLLPGSAFQNIFKEQYSGHDIVFWRSLQMFHDKEDNWNLNGKGLTELGQKKLDEL